MFTDTLASIALASGGRLLDGEPNARVKGVFSDTRAAVPGGLFVALRGENFDGNQFARAAVEQGGAAAVLVDSAEAARSVPPGAGAILAVDTREAFLRLAALHRERLTSALWFGVTGSVGKSSTKEMLAHTLERAANWKVHKARASFNNAIGLSHTILSAGSGHRAVVLELGTNHPGEIRALADAARPNISIITRAAESHLEAFKSVANVAREKADILAFQRPADVAVLNADDAYYLLWRALARGKTLSFGFGAHGSVRAHKIQIGADGCASFVARCGGASSPCRLRVPGSHQAANALAVLAACMAAGIPLENATAALGSFEGVQRRFAMKESGGVMLIDDAYNANPASFRAALDTLKTFKGARRFVIAGDMLELGLKTGRYHRELGSALAQCGLTAIVTVGSQASLAGAAAMNRRPAPLSWVACNTPEEAGRALKPSLRAGDVVLVKGSHGVKLEKCLKILQEA